MSMINKIRLNLGLENDIQDFTLVVAKPNHDMLGQLTSFTELNLEINLNSADNISFSSYKYLDAENKTVDPLWEELKPMRLIWVKELNEYFKIEVEVAEENTLIKNVVGVGAAEEELGQQMLFHLEINTEDDINREDYDLPTIFYNPQHPEASLLHRAMEKIPQWSVRHVDNSLAPIQRTFSANDESVYDFFTKTVAEEIGCLFQFDSVEREVNVYDLKTRCIDCGERGYYSFVCPNCGSTNLLQYGTDTQVFFDVENLATSVRFETDNDGVKNCFHLEAGDENATADIRNINPNGSNYIYYFSNEAKADMPEELVRKMDEYDVLYKFNLGPYQQLMEEAYKLIDDRLNLQSKMMPNVETEETSAKEEIRNVTAINLSPVGLTALNPNTLSKSAENAIKNYVKVYVNSGRFDIKVNTASWNVAANGANNYIGTWRGTITLTSFSDDEDTATTSTLTITVNNNYSTYLEQRILAAAKYDADHTNDGSIFDMFDKKTIAAFKSALKLYCLNSLLALDDAYQNALDILISSDQANPKAEMYTVMYVPYLERKRAIEAEISVRQKEIEEIEEKEKENAKKRAAIQSLLNFEKFIGPDLYKVFCMYKREQLWQNTNYIIDGLEDDERAANAKEFYEAAQKEIVRSGEYQHQISGKLIDFLAMPEFEDFLDYVVLGNWVNVRIGVDVYRLRLISLGLDFERPEDITVEFSDVERIRHGFDDTRSILDQSDKMASSFGGVKNQANKGADRADYMDDWVHRGLDLTNLKILSNADCQEMVLNDQGLWMKRWNYEQEIFEPEQVRIINNGLYYTNDYWETIKVGIGHFVFYNPRNDFKPEDGYGILAETIVGQLILAEDVGIYTPNGSFTINENGYIQTIDMNGVTDDHMDIFKIQRKELDGTINELFVIDASGVVTINGEFHVKGAKYDRQLGKIEDKIRAEFDVGDDYISSVVVDEEAGLESRSEITAEGIINTVSNSTEGLSSQSIQTAQGFWQKVTDEINKTQSLIEQTANSIRLGVGDLNGALNSYIEILENQITLRVGKDDLMSEIQLRQGELDLTATNCINFKSQTFDFTGSTFNLSATSAINMNGGEVNISGSKITMTSATTFDIKGYPIVFNDKVKIMSDGHLWGKDADFEDVVLNNMTANNDINMFGKFTFVDANRTMRCDIGLDDNRAGRIRLGSYFESDGGESTGFAVYHDGLGYFHQRVEIGKNFVTGDRDVYDSLLIAHGNLKVADGAIYGTMGAAISLSAANLGNHINYTTLSTSQEATDKGYAIIPENGEMYIELDPVYASQIEGKPYIFLQSYTPSPVSLLEVNQGFFIVQGEPGTEFVYEIKGNVKGTTGSRLNADLENTSSIEPPVNYGEMNAIYALEQIQQIMEENNDSDYVPYLL